MQIMNQLERREWRHKGEVHELGREKEKIENLIGYFL